LKAQVNLLKRILHITLSVWLSLLLLFGGTAKEFIHLFASHEDTACNEYKSNETVIEGEHHHCGFLQFSLASFINDVSLPVIFIIPASYITHNTRLQLSQFQSEVPALFLRGPPAVFA
jgi:hypothetical protein